MSTISTTASVQFGIELTRVALQKIPCNEVSLQGRWMHMDMEMGEELSNWRSVSLTFLVHSTTRIHASGHVLRSNGTWDEGTLVIVLPDNTEWEVHGKLTPSGTIDIDKIVQS